MLLYSSEFVDSESSQFFALLIEASKYFFSFSFPFFLSFSFTFSLSLSFYVVKIFALVGAIPDLIRRIPLGIRG